MEKKYFGVILINLIVIVGLFSYPMFADEIGERPSTVEFNNVFPYGEPTFISNALEFSISSEGTWYLDVQALSNLRAGALEIPIERLSFFPKTKLFLQEPVIGEWTPFSLEAQRVAEGEYRADYLVSLDLQFETKWGDLSSDEEYVADLLFTLSHSSLDSPSYAWPNPFLVGEEEVATTIYYEGTRGMIGSDNQIRIYDQNNHLVTQGFPSYISEDGKKAYYEWNGRDYNGFLVQPGIYSYHIYPQVLGAGFLTVLDPAESDDGQGDSTVFGHVRDQEQQILEGAKVALFKAGRKTPHLETITDAAGRYEFDNLSDGHYYLQVTHDYYLNYYSSIFYLRESESNEQNVILTHNSPFFMEVRANRHEATVGDIIEYKVELTNIGKGPIYQGMITELLPSGLSYIVGSSHLNGEKIEPHFSNGTLIWDLEPLDEEEKVTLSYELLVDFSASDGWLHNGVVASGEADKSVELGPLSAPVNISQPTFKLNSHLLGRAIYADSGNGVKDLKIKLSNGAILTSDKDGFFAMPSLESDTYRARVLPESLEEGWKPSKDNYFISLVGGVPHHLEIELIPGDVSEPEFAVYGTAGLETGFLKKNTETSFTYRGNLNVEAVGTISPGYDLEAEVNLTDQVNEQPNIDLFINQYSQPPQSPVKLKLATPYGNFSYDIEDVERSQVGIGLTKVTKKTPLLAYNLKSSDKKRELITFLGFEAAGKERETLPAVKGAGPYELKQDNIVPYSEEVVVQIKDGNKIMSERKIAYVMDYNQGIVYLKEHLAPVNDGNDVYLSISYEYPPENLSVGSTVYGIGAL